jgi:hypothetical protein
MSPQFVVPRSGLVADTSGSFAVEILAAVMPGRTGFVGNTRAGIVVMSGVEGGMAGARFGLADMETAFGSGSAGPAEAVGAYTYSAHSARQTFAVQFHCCHRCMPPPAEPTDHSSIDAPLHAYE